MDQPEKRSIDARAGYDLWAETYDHTENPVVALDERVLAGFLGPLGGARVVDAGCGTGRHTVALARAAAHVTALDFAPAMLDRTRAKLRALGLEDRVTLLGQDLRETPYPMAAHSTDGVLCALVGEHIDDLPRLFAEFARLLAPGGWLVFSVYHPLLALGGAEANFLSPSGDIEYRLGAFQHRVSDYVGALLGAGLELCELCEPRADAELVAQVPMAGKFLDRPVLLVLRGRARQEPVSARVERG